MITQNIGTCAQSEENYGISVGLAMPVINVADSSSCPAMYICPNDLAILDPNECVATSDLIIEHDLKSIPIQFWPDLYDEIPHKIPNHYPPAARKLEFKSKTPLFICKIYKQPISKSGFKRGQRR